jgi:hypothetical protein
MDFLMAVRMVDMWAVLSVFVAAVTLVHRLVAWMVPLSVAWMESGQVESKAE